MESQYRKLTDSQWEAMKSSLPTDRKRLHSLRVIADTIFYVLRVGCQWRNLPQGCFPKWQLVYYYFRLWKSDGTLERLNWALNMRERRRQGKADSPSMVSIDSQSVKAGPFISQETGVDGNKKVNGRKRHVVTDTLGLVWGVVVHGANRADGALARRVVEPMKGYLHRMEKILADAAYQKGFMAWVEESLLGVELEVSSKPPGTEGFAPVRWRWVTERAFGMFSFFSRLDKDHEKTTESAESWVLWQNCQVILNRLG
ncbi:IS5 family transposase [Rufibacter sp. LB8]|uniref:IS5 family transposase n=3 Tax=Rufibacter sp. LB8 TaxID=2777781 RepID=UPI00178C27EC|nr:IS5 family transposase [Rufibacter sp. LB8]